MKPLRCTSSALTKLWALIGVVALLGFTLSGPAYADKPTAPGSGNGQSGQKSTTSAGSGGNSSSSKSTKSASSAKSSSAKSSSTKSTGSDHSQGNSGTSGTYNQPQPYSHADQNNSGANDTSATNQYKSTRDGSASGNGNGGGKATGKPCAGCVGKADNKNPKGQFPNGTDHNKGYECDGNNGIARTNPAHTACTRTTPPPPPPPCIPTLTNPCTPPPPPPPCTPTQTNPCTPPPPPPPCTPSDDRDTQLPRRPPCTPAQTNRAPRLRRRRCALRA